MLSTNFETTGEKFVSAKEQLIQEIDQAPDFLVHEVLDFLLFLKLKLSQPSRSNQEKPEQPVANLPNFLKTAQEISRQIPSEEWANLPSDLSRNLDHYLYGAPKVD